MTAWKRSCFNLFPCQHELLMEVNPISLRPLVGASVVPNNLYIPELPTMVSKCSVPQPIFLKGGTVFQLIIPNLFSTAKSALGEPGLLCLYIHQLRALFSCSVGLAQPQTARSSFFKSSLCSFPARGFDHWSEPTMDS